jgi:hypothetical protein
MDTRDEAWNNKLDSLSAMFPNHARTVLESVSFYRNLQFFFSIHISIVPILVFESQFAANVFGKKSFTFDALYCN